MKTASGRINETTARRVAIGVLVYLSIAMFMGLVVRNLDLPDGPVGMDASFGPFNAFLQETSGKWVTTDIQSGLAAASALLHGQDPYQVSATLFDQYSYPAWDVQTANPWPPTTLSMLVPFALLSYQNALTAWTVLMIFAVIGTIQLMGVRLAYAAPIGLAISILFPMTYGLGNPVPVIGLGIALAYRFRDHPLLAAVGLTLAAAPKASGLLLLAPFVLTLRIKPVMLTAGFMAVLALFPMVFYPGVWARYLDSGVDAITRNAARADNAALLNLAGKIGLPFVLAFGLIVLAAVVAAWLIKDTFWPVVWLIVALLPIAWSYSLVTLIPLFCVVVLNRPNPWGVGAVALSTALAIGSPPLGLWPTRIVPLVLLLAYVALLQVRGERFWPDLAAARALLRRPRSGAESVRGPAPTQVGPDRPTTR